MTQETILTQLISNVGFPIAISVYFIIRMEKIIRDNTKAISLITQEIKILSERLKSRRKV